MEQERIHLLIAKHQAGTLTDAEKQELENIINPHPALPNLLQQMKDKEALDKALQIMAGVDIEQNVETILGLIHQDSRKRRSRILMWTSVLIIISFILYKILKFIIWKDLWI